LLLFLQKKKSLSHVTTGEPDGATLQNKVGRKDSSFSEEKEAKRLFYGCRPQAGVPGMRRR
jgi:hypothetical protein